MRRCAHITCHHALSETLNQLFSERLIHNLAGLTALRPSQHCITNLIDVEMTGRTSTKVTQFLIQRWKIVNDSVF
jgi:hypothetical protein